MHNFLAIKNRKEQKIKNISGYEINSTSELNLKYYRVINTK
jgi:hypothetical protein